MSARKPDAYCIHKTNGDILCLVRTEERARAWQNDVPDLPVIPLYRRTSEDVETLKAAAKSMIGRSYYFGNLGMDENARQCEQLAAKLRELAGEQT